MSVGHCHSRVIALTIFLCLAISAGCSSDPETESPPRNPLELELEILSGPEELTNQRSAEFELICNRDIGCEFRCSLDEADFEICESPAVFENISDGGRVFTALAIDEFGAESEPAIWEWTVDNEEPLIAITKTPPQLSYELSALFEFECTNKENCTFQCALEDADGLGEWKPCLSQHVVEGLSIGDQALHIQATDPAGNQILTGYEWTVSHFEWASISAGFRHLCGTATNGSLWCWGDSSQGGTGMGEGAREIYTSPQRVDNQDLWTSATAGSYHGCGIRDGGTLWCWGGDDINEFEEFETFHPPFPVGGHDDWSFVSAGFAHVCALRGDNTLWCWGIGWAGQLGLGEVEITPLDGPPGNVGGDSQWKSLASGGLHTCAVRASGTLWCWGQNTNKQLGIATGNTYNSPQQVSEISDWSSVSAGWEHTCAIRDDGTLWCWGGGSRGQLGLDNITGTSSPERVGDDMDWSKISAGFYHTCGIRDDGTLWCWGEGYDGQLATDDGSNHFVPNQIGYDSGWRSVTAGLDFNCAVRDNGSLWCWGINDYGQLGLGDTEDRIPPRRVDDPTN